MSIKSEQNTMYFSFNIIIFHSGSGLRGVKGVTLTFCVGLEFIVSIGLHLLLHRGKGDYASRESLAGTSPIQSQDLVKQVYSRELGVKRANHLNQFLIVSGNLMH